MHQQNPEAVWESDEPVALLVRIRLGGIHIRADLHLLLSPVVGICFMFSVKVPNEGERRNSRSSSSTGAAAAVARCSKGQSGKCTRLVVSPWLADPVYSHFEH